MTRHAAKNAFAIDMHFHANVDKRSRNHRAKIARKLSRRMGHLDALCSTEHAYKDPLAAYDFLCDMVDRYDLDLEIVAGVENISSEGVDVIQLVPNRDSLKQVLSDFPAFAWSIEDAEWLRHADCLTILPHPFSPSRTGIVTGIGLERTKALLPHFDYIEVSNGSFLDVPAHALPLPLFRAKVELTAQFPLKLLPEGVGHAYGSDAHTPKGMNLSGIMERLPDQSLFEALAQRQVLLPQRHAVERGRSVNNLANGLIISGVEYLEKQNFKLSNSREIAVNGAIFAQKTARQDRNLHLD